MFEWQTGLAILLGVLGLAAIVAFIANRSEPKDAVAAWDAGFAKIEKTGLAGATGIYLGHDPTSKTVLHYNGDRHLMTFGPNGSGKSMRLLYQNLMTLRDWSLLVIDPKGELATLTGAERAKHGKVICLNPYDVRGLPSHGFNPVATLDPGNPETFIDDAMGLAEAMIRINPQAKESHWAESAQDLVCALLMYAALRGGETNNLAFVRECLGLPAAEMIDTVTAMRVMGAHRKIDELSIKAARFMDINPENRELTSIVSTAMTQTRWLDSRLIKADTSKGVINFAAMTSPPTTIYLILPANRLATQSTWLRLVITSCLQQLIRDAVPGKVPTMLMLDEFANLGHLPMIENTNWSWSGRTPSFSGSQQGMPLLMPQAVRGMGNGETVIFSHVANGPVRAFVPFPSLGPPLP